MAVVMQGPPPREPGAPDDPRPEQPHPIDEPDEGSSDDEPTGE